MMMLRNVGSTSRNPRPAYRTPIATAIAMALMAGLAGTAQAQTPLSSAWAAARHNAPPSRPVQPGPDRPGNNGLRPGGVARPGDALRQPSVQRTVADLGRAAAAISAEQLRQKQAAEAARNRPTSFNGLGEEGLKVAEAVAGDPSLWQNAQRPTESRKDGQTTVDIKQTDKRAVLTWDRFDVGDKTTVRFDQSKGNQAGVGNDWVALNRITDPSGRPSQIRGQIKAEGSVYLLNRNGIVFGAGSQVNTRSLIASSLHLLSQDTAESNRVFLEQGIAGVDTVTPSQDYPLLDSGLMPGESSEANLERLAAIGDINIETGASITTGSGGFSLIAAPNVDNAGSVSAQDGQATLAAVLRVELANAGEQQPPEERNRLPLRFTNVGPLLGNGLSLSELPFGRLSNSGLVASTRGEVILTGHIVDHSGVAVASTSIDRPGSLRIAAVDYTGSDWNTIGGGETTPPTAGGILRIAPKALIAVLPERDGQTTTSGPAADLAFRPGSASLIGAQIHFQPGALLLSPGGDVVLQGLQFKQEFIDNGLRPTPPARILIEDGATINVAGLPDVQLPMSVNLVTIPRIGQNELADSPGQRGGPLQGEEVTVDRRVNGDRDDGLGWVGSPLLNAGGYTEQMPRKIDEMLIDGGSIDISAGDLILRPGATLNLDGGYLHYLGGMVQTRKLVDAEGRVYTLAEADPMANYIGFAGEYTREHPRWGVSETYVDPLLSRQRYYESAYIHGGDAGELTLEIGSGQTVAPDPNLADPRQVDLLAGQIHANAYSGRYQVKLGQHARGGRLEIAADGDVILRADRPDVPADLQLDTPIDALPGIELPRTDRRNPASWTVLSTDMLNAGGFSAVSITQDVPAEQAASSQILVQADADLRVQPGGEILLSGGRVDVLGALSAESGSIAVRGGGRFLPMGQVQEVDEDQSSLFLDGGVYVAGNARLNARGQWVNDLGLRGDEQLGGAFIDGGSIELSAAQGAARVATSDPTNPTRSIDGSGSVVLEDGALLDVSGGGRIGQDGRLAMLDGVPLGRGGDITLRTYDRSDIPQTSASDYARLPAAHAGIGVLRFAGADLRADSLGGGGTLNLQTRAIQIGGEASGDPRDLYLAPDFFTDGSFGAYRLDAELDAVIAADTQVKVSQRSFIADPAALRTAATGTDLYAGAQEGGNAYGRFGRLNPSLHPATDFAMRGAEAAGRPAGDSDLSPSGATTLLDHGASLVLDPGAEARLESRGPLTVLGSITAHGGAITLSGDTNPEQSQNEDGSAIGGPAYFSPDKSVWLGADSLLDVSGITVIDPYADPVGTPQGPVIPRTGQVLDGGTITLSNDGGYVVVEEGARLDLSGTRDQLQLRTGDTRQPLATREVWSDGGALTLAATAGLFFDGSIAAQGGDAQARGGTLNLLPQNQSSETDGTLATSAGIVFTQSDSRLPEGAAPGAAIEPDRDAPSGLLYFSADRLQGAGIDTLVAGVQSPDSETSLVTASVPIAFSGDIELALQRALLLNAPSYVLLPEGSDDLAAAGSDHRVSLSAGYVGFNGYRFMASGAGDLDADPLPAATGGTLAVAGDFIDIGGQFSLRNIANAHFTSAGDLRLRTPALHAFGESLERIPGELLTAGNLTFQAAQVYPVTGEQFIIRAVGAVDPDTGERAATTVRFLGNSASSQAPLSAGGSLLVNASQIVQAGTLRAPAGRIVLGVGDPQDADARALYGARSIVATDRVQLADGSLTSVSLDGLTVPYGATVDGLDWKFNAHPTKGGGVNLTAPPAKLLQINGNDIALDDGASVDLSGGGKLTASEWIAGTGGSRDVLSQYNTSYADGDTGTPVPLYPDERAVYAILPGSQSPVAAADPILERGQAPIDVGRSVYLSGVPGLPAGVYTLLPAKYAVLPGAMRLVQHNDAGDRGARDSVAAHNRVLRDGSAVVSGYYVDAFTGARDARSISFQVQSRDVWGRYSEYTSTDADAFFAAAAEKKGLATPRLVRDGGQLVLGASSRLDLGASLDASAGEGGAAALVDIAAQALQIVGPGQDALDGHVQLDAGGLNSLGAGSLLIGGVRSQTEDGLRLDATADSLVVSNDADNPLRGAEIMLVSNAEGDGLRVDAGSVIEASGELGGAGDTRIVIGQAPDADGAGGISGAGALLRVSNSGDASIVRHHLPALDEAGGALQIGAGARLDGGASLALDATGTPRVDADATLAGTGITANASRIVFAAGDDASAQNALIIGPRSLDQFAAAERVTLGSYGRMDFVGDVQVDVDQALTLNAGNFSSDGGDVRLRAERLTLGNAGLAGAPEPVAPSDVPGAGVLELGGSEVVFGAGDTVLTGFGQVLAQADEAIIGREHGSFDFGASDITLRAPLIQADAGADTALTSTGDISLDRSVGQVADDAPIGGRLALTGASIAGDALIRANAGTVALRSTQGDVRLERGALVDVSGAAKTFFDTEAYAPGGSIMLTADQGQVQLANGASLDFSAAANGGDAGALEIEATQGTAQLQGDLRGRAEQGVGGSFSLDAGGAVGLDALAERLADSGVERAITIRSNTGNLLLSEGSTLTAREISLTADGGADAQQRSADHGNIIIDGMLDASGTRGGEIALWGRHGVAVNGRLLATGSSATQRGGDVILGTSGRSDGSLNALYGYQNVQAADAGVIALGPDARIDVSGGSAGGLSGGTLNFRAPLLADGEVNVDIAEGTRVDGAREVGLEAYAVWSSVDPVTDPSKHFDGIVDPAGWYNADGELLSGTWTDHNGAELAPPSGPEQLADYLDQHYFTPDAANADRQTFYGYANGHAEQASPGTLMGFVQTPGFAFNQRLAQRLPDLVARAGVELRNPDANQHDGAIRVLTNWNLGSGASPTNRDYRTDGVAPLLTLRAVGDVEIAASISDGFYSFIGDPDDGEGPRPGLDYDTAYAAYLGLKDQWDLNAGGVSFDDYLLPPEEWSGGQWSVEDSERYYGQYLALANIYSAPQDELGGSDLFNYFLLNYAWVSDRENYPNQPAPPVAPDDRAAYPGYVSDYESYLLDLNDLYFNSPSPTGALPTLMAPVLPMQPLTGGGGGVTDRTPTLQASAANPAPFASAGLVDGDSSSYRFVAGADFGSTAPATTRPGAQADIVLDGRTTYREDGSRDIVLPTVVRTGTGAIEFSAAQDLRFADEIAPASIYTAGRPVAGTSPGTDLEILRNNPVASTHQTVDILVGGQATSEAAGDILIAAGRDIRGNRQTYDRTGAITGVEGDIYIGQYWWPWMQTANGITNTDLQSSQLNFGGFAQGVLSAGGNVAVSAGRDVRELSVSLPTTWVRTDAPGGLEVYGGGDLSVQAGGDVLGGDYFVARGVGQLTAGGNIGSAFDLTSVMSSGAESTPVAPILALQDAAWNVVAAGDAQIGAVVNPSYLYSSNFGSDSYGFARSDSTPYGVDSALSVDSIGGNVRFGTMTTPNPLFSYGGMGIDGSYSPDFRIFSNVLPASLSLTALSGDVSVEKGGQLFPSARGNLSLLAAGDLQLFNTQIPRNDSLTLLDVRAADLLPSPFQQLSMTEWEGGDFRLLDNLNPGRSQIANLHVDDDRPVRLYALDGDIVNGLARDGYQVASLTVDLPKPALIRAGRDIVDLNLRGQNLNAADVTSVVAGRDLYYTPILGSPVADPRASWRWLELAGPGLFEVQAGRDLGQLTPAIEAYEGSFVDVTQNEQGGIRTTGNRDNAGLPYAGANIALRFGVAPGLATADFAQRYLNPDSEHAAAYGDALIAFMQQRIGERGMAMEGVSSTAAAPSGGSGSAGAPRMAQDTPGQLSLAQAWQAFSQEPAEVQQRLVDRIFIDVLKRAGVDYNNPDSPGFGKYASGYEAINTLFPAGLGYTANNLEGGENGAATQVSTGSLDMRGSTVQTQQGGDIHILAPGGSVLVGSLSASPVVRDAQGEVVVGPNQQGILTMAEGDIGIFTDLDVQLAQSRIFTQRGGDLTMWSSNGDINAGKGSKTSSDRPPVLYRCDQDFYCLVDAKGQVSGAGIATLQTVPGAPLGDAVLVAPRGTVDAGDAGIRVAGNLVVAAQFVANADNIQVQGETIGVPTVAAVNVGALTAASAAATATTQAVQEMQQRQREDARDRAGSVITVNVLGFGNRQ